MHSFRPAVLVIFFNVIAFLSPRDGIAWHLMNQFLLFLVDSIVRGAAIIFFLFIYLFLLKYFIASRNNVPTFAKYIFSFSIYNIYMILKKIATTDTHNHHRLALKSQFFFPLCIDHGVDGQNGASERT